MIVEDYLRYVAKLKGLSGQDVDNGVARALGKTNLDGVRKRLIRNLSKGFRQRVGIAQALVHDPEVLILDEPTVGLDPKQVIEIRNMVQELAGGHTVILSTHILPEVTATCRRIIIINGGRIVAEDTYENLNRRMSASRSASVIGRSSGVPSLPRPPIMQSPRCAIAPASRPPLEAARRAVAARRAHDTPRVERRRWLFPAASMMRGSARRDSRPMAPSRSGI